MALTFGQFTATQTAQSFAAADFPQRTRRLTIRTAAGAVTVYPNGYPLANFTIPANTTAYLGQVDLPSVAIGWTAGTVVWWSDPV